MIKETLRGVIRGNTIELEEPAGLPDGQQVAVTVHVTERNEEALRRAFGSWADAGEELDRFLEQMRRDRQASRPEQMG